MGTQPFDRWLTTGRNTRLSPAAVQQLRDAAEEIDECGRALHIASACGDRSFYIVAWGLIVLALEAVPIAARWIGFENELPPGRIAIPAIGIAVLLVWADHSAQKRRISQAHAQTLQLNEQYFRRWGATYAAGGTIITGGPDP